MVKRNEEETQVAREAVASTPVEKTSRAIAHSAVTAGRAIGKTGARIAKPIARTVKHEDTRTLTKMAVAAITPQLINMAVRLALRNPVLTAIGVLVVVTALGSQDDKA